VERDGLGEVLGDGASVESRLQNQKKKTRRVVCQPVMISVKLFTLM
jgi:hypothetical protein